MTDQDQQQQHPLCQPVVVNVLMELVPKSAWKTCRLVCKSWHEELLPRWRKEMKVRIGGLGKSNMFIASDKVRSKANDVSSFMTTYQPYDVHQYEKFPFRFIQTVSGQVNIESTRIQRSFWKSCGPWLHGLHFHGVMFKDVGYLKDIIFKLTPNLQQLEFSGCDTDVLEVMQNNTECNKPLDLNRFKPSKIIQSNLKVLKISSEACTRTSLYYAKFPLSFLSIFSVFTNIEELDLREVNFKDNTGRELVLDYLFDAIRTIRVTSFFSKLNIKKLHIRDMRYFNGLTSDLVSKLCALCLPLEDLHVFITNKNRALEQLLSKYFTLTKLGLRLIGREPLDESTFQFRFLPQTLTELTLDGCVFADWSFLAFTPNLTKLGVKQDRHEHLIKFPEQFPNDRTPLLEFITTFAYTSVNLLRAEDVEMLTRIMPNVIKLTLSVDSHGFRTVCNAWTELTYWEITYAKVKQAAFIAHISKLTCLTCLEMNVAGNRNDGREIMKGFGNNTIKNGFLKLPKLQKLSITFTTQIKPP